MTKRQFRKAVQAAFQQPIPLIHFPQGTMVEISLAFYMARLLYYFTGRNRERKKKDNIDEGPTIHKRNLDNRIKFCLGTLQEGRYI
jgi:hypothetical protein